MMWPNLPYISDFGLARIAQQGLRGDALRRDLVYAFSGAVKDLRLGTLVGTRTSGIVSAPADAYLLDDASLLIVPAKHELSADHELINGIGVAPDYYLPLTARDLSTGHDPDITKALTLLGG